MLAEPMRPIPLHEWDIMRYRFMHAGERISKLPFCQVKPHALDSFGSLRAWPKWKSVAPLLALTSPPAEGSECPMFLQWLNAYPCLSEEVLGELLRVPGDLWSGIRWRPLVSFMKFRWRKLCHLVGKFCLHTLRTLNAGFHISNPRAFVERVHRYNTTTRPSSDEEYYHQIYDDDDVLNIKIFDLRNFFPEVPHEAFDVLLRFAISLLLTRNPRWRYF